MKTIISILFFLTLAACVSDNPVDYPSTYTPNPYCLSNPDDATSPVILCKDVKYSK